MTLEEMPPGLYPGIPSAEYHAHGAGHVVSKSALTHLSRSPAHYQEWRANGGKDSDALAFGRAFHCALLEPVVFETIYAVEPDFGDCRRKEPKAARDAWRAENVGREHLASDDAATIGAMCRAVRAHPLAGRMMRDGQAELTCRWTDAATGLPCKSRADYYVKSLRMVADVKSTENAASHAFRRDIASYRYGWQDALYRAGFAAVGESIEHFVFIAVEKSAPHAVGIYTLDGGSVAACHEQVTAQIEKLAECVRTNEWPGYPVGIQTVELPSWAA